MPRSLWTGSLSFGLVNVQVALYSAVRDVGFHFRQIHAKDGALIETRRFCSKEDVEVAWEDVAHGYDLDGKQVILTDEELQGVAPRKTRTIDIDAFVDRAEIDPLAFDHPYFLLPAGESEGTRRAYALLVEVLSDGERVAIGRFVLRSKEYLVAIGARDDRLTLTTMLFHDEIRPIAGIGTGGAKPKKAQLDGAVALIEELSVDWDPERYDDCYRKRLRGVINKKKKGKRIAAPKPDKEPEPTPDLMAALKRSLQEAKRG